MSLVYTVAKGVFLSRSCVCDIIKAGPKVRDRTNV